MNLPARAAVLPLVNGSFESPQTNFAVSQATGWTITGPPDTGVAGVFRNTAPDSASHISNAVGDQLAFISSETGNAMSQVIAGSVYEAGTAYTLRVGIARSHSLPPRPTDALRLALFYTAEGGQRQLLAFEDVFNSPAHNLSANAVKYFSAYTAPLAVDDPAVGKPVGVMFTTIGQLGGYFDMENVTVETGIHVGREEVLASANLPEPRLGLATLLLFAMIRRRRTV